MNILIDTEIIPSGEYDIFSKTDPQKWFEIIQNDYNGYCFNTGNKLWFQAIVSEISTPENKLFFLTDEMTHDYINSNFDMIIAPMANIFSLEFYDLLHKLSVSFNKYTIPVYVIACGVQSSSYDKLDELVMALKEPASEFIRAVYQSGGEFALRGYFTQEFFKKLGFNSAVVTGCPSLFQMGRDLPDKLPPHPSCRTTENIKFALNGKLNNYRNIMNKYQNSIFFDQGHYYNILNNKKYIVQYKNIFSISRLNKINFNMLDIIAENRIKLFPDMNDWYSFLVEEKFDFSFGSRIHGNIMPLLAGIPAVVDSCDTRTAEMAEFFNIPTATLNGENDILEIYCEADYSKFKNGFKEKFDSFEKFLIDLGIVKHINQDNLFLKKDNCRVICENKTELNNINHIIKKNKLFFNLLSRM